MTMTATAAHTVSGTTTKQKVGLVLGALYCLSNVPSVFMQDAGSGSTDGPPIGILALDTLLGVVGMIACIVAWRGNRLALRIGAVSIIVITLSGLPAFFVDVPMGVKALVGFGVLLTVVIVALMFSGRREPQA
jgi:hypothetical protein